MKVAILGTGAYGLALSLMVNENKCDITMWTKFDDEKEMLECYHENKRVLPGVKIPDNIIQYPLLLFQDSALDVPNASRVPYYP